MSTWSFAASVAALIAVVILLAWRVWRLENLVNRVRERANNSPHATEVGRWFAARDRADDDLRTDWVRTDSRLHQFARALGYEWKRTDAKEGWVQKIEFVDAPWQRKLVGEYLWNNGDCRRKADRRKPAPEIKVKQFCDSCDEKAVKRAKQQLEREINRPKKRRAH